MDSQNTPCLAHVVPRDTFDEALSCLSRARQSASRRTIAAQAAIAKREAALDVRIADFEAKLAAATESRFKALIDEQAIRARADEAALILQEAARFQAAIDAVGPMVANLVACCLKRIIGKLAPEDVLAATVAEAVAELRAMGQLRLLVAPTDLESVNDMVSAAPDRFAAIHAVVPDADLPSGTIHLDGEGGFADISVAAQIDACRDALALVEAAQGAPS